MKKEKSSGCIIFDPISYDKVIVVYEKNAKFWGFPKGHLEEGETLIECAIRETAEETKRDCILLSEVPIICEEYKTPSGEEVIVYYYISKDIGDSDNDSLETHPTIWVKIDAIYNKLTYLVSKEMWLKIKDEVQEYFV